MTVGLLTKPSLLSTQIEFFEEEMRAAGLVIAHKEVRWGEIWAEVVPNGT